MIQFFRKFRKDFLSEGKMWKYLQYAIGEIILVVTGILIALYINNRNQNLQLQKEELKTLKSLQKAIKINRSELNETLNDQILRNKSLTEVLVLKVSEKKLIYLDSLVTANVKNHTFHPSTGIYNSMINSGKIELISNDSLKNRISKLYDSVKDYQQSEGEVSEYTKQHLENNFIENYSINPLVLAKLIKRTAKEKKKDRIYYTRNLSSQKVKNMYILLLYKMNDVIKKGQSLNLEYQSILTALDNEIELKK